MTLRELVVRNRSFRRFQEEVPVPRALLEEWVDLARCSASGGNLQPLRYVLVHDPARRAAVFPTLRWAAYLTDWAGPAPGERPVAYIVILKDSDAMKGATVDHGIAAQSITLGAVEKGFGGCLIGSVDRAALARVLGLPERYEILLVVALGKPAEAVLLEPVRDGNIRYWRDRQGVHHVPKRSLADLLVEAGPPPAGA
jgi:nitroreductase